MIALLTRAISERFRDEFTIKRHINRRYFYLLFLEINDEIISFRRDTYSNGVAARKAHSLGGASSNSVLPRRALLSTAGCLRLGVYGNFVLKLP